MSAEFRCLALETATSQSSLALDTGDGVLSREISDARTCSRQVYRLIGDLLKEGGLQISELDCIAFGCGPGSCTGVRVAASVTQGIAYAQSLPVCRVSTLAALAAGAGQRHAPATVLSCLDARMGEAYLGAYAIADGSVTELEADRLIDPSEHRLAAYAGEVLAVGNGWKVFPELLNRTKTRVDDLQSELWPSAMHVLQLAKLDYLAGDTIAAADALPNYVRNKVTS